MPKGRLTPKSGATEAILDAKPLDPLDVLIEHCTAAKAIADKRGESFLSYMLAMTIQAARSLPRRR